MKDQKLLQKILDNVKPEYRDELKRVLNVLADKWHTLSEKKKAEYAANGVVNFIYEDNADEWKKLPDDLSELTIEGGLH